MKKILMIYLQMTYFYDFEIIFKSKFQDFRCELNIVLTQLLTPRQGN